MSNNKINYSIKKSKRAKRMRLTVHYDGTVVVTTPSGIQSFVVQKLIDEKNNWILKKINFFKEQDLSLVRSNSKADYLKHKDTALILIKQRISHFNECCDFSVNKICIRNQKTRWGSCSQKGNLNFNYRIVFLPEKLQDYIIVHELCHLKEFNHSRRFWALVCEIIPNYANIKKELKKHRLME